MKQNTVVRLALLSVMMLMALAFVIGVPHNALAAPDGQSYYEDMGRIVSGLGVNDKASPSRYASYDAQTCVEGSNLAGTGEFSRDEWSFSLRGTNGTWQSPWYGYDGSHCSPWIQEHNNVYTVVNVDEETSMDAQVWIYTN